MSFLHFLLGRPLSTEEAGEQRIGVPDGVAVFGLDALGSTAYGPEAALTALIPAGIVALGYVVGLSSVITLLLMVVFLSYRQIISAYPNGGGAYTVARQNLGPRTGMLAAAALMLDYLLNVCVGISTGVGALVSAVPKLQPHTLGICLLLLSVILIANLRGVREVAFVWMLPTYLFVGCLLGVTVIGIMPVFAEGGHPHPLTSPSELASAGVVDKVSPWLLIRSFAAGCIALTGVEAVSNGVRNFKDPWQCELNAAARASGTPPPKVVSICSPYRSVTEPIMQYVKKAEEEEPGRKIAVVIAEIVAAHWYHQVMHNYRALLLRLRLLLEGNRRVVIVNLPWQLPPG